MNTQAHAHMVTQQFGPQASAYVASAVHATGEDLQQLAALAKARSFGRMLDLGCGGGHVSFNMAPHVGEAIAYDLSVDMLVAVAQTAAERGLCNIVTRQGAVEKLPFADSTFDCVVSRFSAHHWGDFAAGLREARRVLKKDGVAVFVDVITPEAGLLDTHLQSVELLRDPSHVRNGSRSQWEQALNGAGFQPGSMTARRLRLEFGSWIARMRTPDLHAQAIRSLQIMAPEEVATHFELEADGSFTIDTMTIEAAPRN